MKLLLIASILLASCSVGQTSEDIKIEHERDSIDKVVEYAKRKSDSLNYLADSVALTMN